MEILNDVTLVTAASRVHRPTTVVRPIPLPTGGSGIVTLEGTRQPRHLNEYVDNLSTESKRPSRSAHSVARENDDRVQIPVSQQPKPLVKQQTSRDVENDLHPEDNSIICKHCSKCKCERCKEKRELPSVWLCHKKYHLSADSVLRACTCLFAVEGCFYHATKDYQMDSDVMCADDPCACCSRPHCFKRWLCMATTSLCVPCLCCYWPAKCAIKACTACYNRCTNKGCKCSRGDKKGSQNKRLLLESDSSSA